MTGVTSHRRDTFLAIRGAMRHGVPFAWGIRRTACTVMAAVCVFSTIAGGVSEARAQPADGARSPAPYPELRYFSEIDPGPYEVAGQGFWFVTAQGLNCGIWNRGSFGCSGDIPGAPPDVHQIGWLDRDTRVHYDWTLAVRFPPTRGTLSIPPLSYIESDGTSCATTVDYSTYCVKGPWRLLITPTRTWLNG